MSFIQLTDIEGFPTIVNADHIVYVYVKNFDKENNEKNVTKIVFLDDQWITVKESPEEILELIEFNQKYKKLDRR